MANVQQYNPSGWLQQLGTMLGMGGSDEGYRGSLDTGMTVPTNFNTGDSWTPPSLGGGSNSPVSQTGGLGTGLGFNVGTGQLALGGLSALAGIWNAMQSNKLAKEQFNFQKDFANTNLNNQIKSYNTALEDRLNARGVIEGRDPAYTAAEIDRRRLSR